MTGRNYMENLIIKGERSDFFTPDVQLNADDGVCEIAGESYLEYTGEFYDQIIDWVKDYSSEINKALQFNFKLTYFNTSSFKAILSVLKNLKRYEEKGGNVEVNWYYPDDDYDMLKEAQDLAEGSSLDLNFIPYKLDEMDDMD
jgi:hypothetical protein